jgi:hypothetical protein
LSNKNESAIVEKTQNFSRTKQGLKLNLNLSDSRLPLTQIFFVRSKDVTWSYSLTSAKLGLGFGRFRSLPKSGRLRVPREKQGGPAVVVDTGVA